MDTQALLRKSARRIRRIRSESNLVILFILHPHSLSGWHTHLPRIVRNQARSKKYSVADRIDGGVPEPYHLYLPRHLIQAQGCSRIHAAGSLVFKLDCSHRHQHNECVWIGGQCDAAVANIYRNGFLLSRPNVYKRKLALKCYFPSFLLFQHTYMVNPQPRYLRR